MNRIQCLIVIINDCVPGLCIKCTLRIILRVYAITYKIIKFSIKSMYYSAVSNLSMSHGYCVLQLHQEAHRVIGLYHLGLCKHTRCDVCTMMKSPYNAFIPIAK